MFQLTISDIITLAYKMVVGLPEGSTVPGDAFQDILKFLNMILQEWSGKESFPWEVQNTQVQFTAISSVVNITGETTYYTCIKAHTAALSNKPGSGTDWKLYWAEAGVSTNSADWVVATSYTTNLLYTLSNLSNLIVDVYSARLLNGDTYYPVSVVSRETFEQDCSDYAEGVISKIWMEKSNQQNDVVPILHMHPNLTDITDILFLTVLTMPAQASSPTAKLPIQQKWLKALLYTLCSDISDFFEVTDRWGNKGLVYMNEAILASQNNITGKTLTGAFDL